MTTIEGTVEEVIRELFIRRVPMDTKIRLVAEDAEETEVPIWERSPEERVAAHIHMQATRPPVEGFVLDDSREGIYGDDWRG